jgi:hypothetical protein
MKFSNNSAFKPWKKSDTELYFYVIGHSELIEITEHAYISDKYLDILKSIKNKPIFKLN